MTLLGMWSCQWRELRPINFGSSNSNSNSNSNQTNPSGSSSRITNGHLNPPEFGDENSGEMNGDEELGYGRGRKKSRLGRDGAGDYELVVMKEGGGGAKA